jgi:hypothetical protein
VDEIKKNPAYALGKAAPGAVAMAVGAKVQLAAELNAASKELLAANATTNRIVRLEQESLKAAKASGVPRTPPRGTPDPGLPPGERPVVRDPTTLPPTCWMNQCLRNSIQVAKWRRSGNWVEPVVHADVPASRATVVQEFEKAFGGERAVDPLHGAGGQQAHALGLPVYSSRERIEAVMRELREHGNGIVLVEYENGGHIFNVYGTPDGRAVFYDHHYSAPPPPNVWASARTVSFFRVP